MKKTAEKFIKNEYLDLEKSYILACVFCLQDAISELWARLPLDMKASFYRTDHSNVISVLQEEVIVAIWTYEIKGELSSIDELIWIYTGDHATEFAFKYALIVGNSEAVEYFSQKLTPMRREKMLVKLTKYVTHNNKFHAYNTLNLTYYKNTNVLLFLLSQMDEQQQNKIFKINPRFALMHFFDWPWQQIFMKVVNNVWHLLSAEDYYYFLEVLAEMVINGEKVNDYTTIFSELWQQSIATYENYVVDKCASGYLLSKLVEVPSKEDISLIVKYATLVNKRKNISSETISEDLASSKKMKFLKYFIRNCIPSPKVMEQFQNNFLDRCVSTVGLNRKKCISCKLIGILDEIIQENLNENSDNDYCSPAKRLRK